jgi:hypothetical protein
LDTATEKKLGVIAALRIPVRQSVILTLSAFLLMLIFSAPPMQLKESLRRYSDSANCPASTRDDLTSFHDDKKLILEEEVKKVNEEIKMRIDQEDHWYDYKFLIVGGLLAAFIGRFAIKSKSDKTPEEQLRGLLGSNATCLAMALACVLAFAVDIHVRHNMTVTNQLGNWLAYYAEPALQHSCFQHSVETHPLLMWENFLRTDGGMHVSTLYSFTFWPHLHFLTGIVYLIYLAIFHYVMQHPEPKERLLTFAGFVLVHGSIGVFAWAAHSAPESFEFTFPLTNWSLSGWKVPALYLLPVLLLALLNFNHFRSQPQKISAE